MPSTEFPVASMDKGPVETCSTRKSYPGSVDEEALALLTEIFPEASMDELEDIHQNRSNAAKRRINGVSSEQTQHRFSVPLALSSPLGTRVLRVYRSLQDSNGSVPSAELPADFLRIPDSVAVKLRNEKTGVLEWLRVSDLERNVVAQLADLYDPSANGDTHAKHQSEIFEGSGSSSQTQCVQDTDAKLTSDYLSRAINRNATVGLGMTLLEYNSGVFVHSVVSNDGLRFESTEDAEHFIERRNGNDDVMGPAYRVGIRPGDRLLGMNGMPFLPRGGFDRVKLSGTLQNEHQSTGLLTQASETIKNTPDPVVLHLQRYSGKQREVPPALFANAAQKPSFDDRPVIPHDPKEYPAHKYHGRNDAPSRYGNCATPHHPLAAALEARGLLDSPSEKRSVTDMHCQFMERARQWESEGSLRVESSSSVLRHIDDPLWSKPKSSVYSTPTNSTIDNTRGSVQENEQLDMVHNNEVQQEVTSYPSNALRRSLSMAERDYFIDMTSVRKGLCVRIVNSFLDGDRTAYTIWVCDVETGVEWYAPIRYQRDFKDLRQVCAAMCGAVLQLPFPSKGWGVFQSKEALDSESAKELKCMQLEQFIRGVCGLIYKGPLHPEMAEVSFHLQSFIGCDICHVGCEAGLNVHQQVAVNETSGSVDGHDEEQSRARLQLQRSLQQYVYRLFLLPVIERVVSQFIAEAKKRAPSLDEMRAMDRKSMTALKDSALGNVERIQDVLGQVFDLIEAGCRDDMMSIVSNPRFNALQKLEKESGGTYIDSLVHQAIREQVEIEVYVPLRSIISRQLVNGWRHDDMEAQFKLKELHKKPQAYFKIPAHLVSPSNWTTCSEILREGVGLSTLPCVKLRAVVAAAKEISRLFTEEHGKADDVDKRKTEIVDVTSAESASLGADDFLPIFIFCVVRAEIERPCALCALLRTFCDPSKQIGETGYFLASFEAAIEHVRELDLTAYHTDIR